MALFLNRRPRQQVVLLVTLVTVASLLWQRWQSSQSESAPAPPDDALLGQPDLYMEQARVTEFDTQGALKYQFQAREIRRFEQDRITRLTEPTLELRKAGQYPWQIQAQAGYIREEGDPVTGGDQIFLRDEVQLDQKLDNGRFINIRAERASLFPDREYAESTRSVMIDTEVGRTRAAGFTADLAGGIFNLSSNENQRIHTIILRDQFK